jgi:hypothetical protein
MREERDPATEPDNKFLFAGRTSPLLGGLMTAIAG